MKKLNYLIAMAVTAFTFTSCEDVPEPFGQPINPNAGETVVVEPKGSGTETDPFNAAGVLEKAKTLTADQTTDEEYYIKGYVTDPPSYTTYSYDISPSTKYNNATFGLADEKDGTSIFFIFRCKGLGGGDITDAEFIKKGDLVVIKGKLSNYKGNSPQTAQNAAYIVSINGQGGGDTPTPPSGDAKAVSVADFLAAAVNTTDFYQLTGTIKNLKEGDQYGNFDIEDATGSVYVYGLLSEKGGEKKKFQELVAAKGIANGKKITIIGNRGEFNSTAQVANAYFVKIEDGEGGGGTPTPSGDNLLTNGDFETWSGSTPDNWNGAAGNATLEKSTDAHGGSAAVLIKTNSANKRLSYKAITLKKGTYNISFYAKAVAGTAKIAPGYVAIVNGAPDSQNYKYPETYPEVGTEWTAVNHSFTLDADTELCLVIMKHKSTANDVIIDDYVLSTTDGGIADGGGEGGGDTPSGDVQTVTIAQFNAAAVSTSVWYQLTGTVKNMKEDGSDLYGNFDIEDATGSVYVYGLLSEKGGAKKKFQELVAAKGIANGKKITIIGNRADFKGTAQVGNAYFVSIE
jgi:RPA family protein